MPSSARTSRRMPSVSDDRIGELLAARTAVRVGQPGDEQGIDPFAVGGAVHLRGEFGTHVACETGFHLGKARQVAVVRERPAARR